MIYPILSNSYSSNCYLLIDKKTVLIDSGIGDEVIKKLAELTEKFNIGKIDFLINTHCHYDHAANDMVVKEKWNAKIAMHVAEIINENSTLVNLFNGKFVDIPVDIKLKEGDIINLGKIKLKIIHTPGHTKGGICLYDEKTRALFSGDTIFSDGIGRTDFFGGDFNELKVSVEKILKLKENSGIDNLYPGHGIPGLGEDIERVYKEWFYQNRGV